MDVQTENTEPPPSESQPSGKIRKGFKLFGKRKPGNIFSIRSKSEGNNKSPLHRSKTLDVPDSAANDSEDQEKDKTDGDEEQTEEGPLGEDGVLAAAPARTSISSASSAKSLGFLSILRGGRRGVGDRRVQTVSQPVGRQRRGIKGLFGNVKFRSKDKEEKEEVPPSPLLMSSRSNSVEIIKEDLTLTPKSHPRSLDSPGTESSEPTNKSLTAQDSSTTSPTRTPGGEPNESHCTMQAAMVPGETSLSTLLADISSLLTFDSISGGGDIMADVEAEWGKASISSDVSPSYTTSFSKPVSSPLSSVSPKPVNSFHTTLPSSTTPSSPMKPSSIITTLTKSTTLTTPTIKPTNETTTDVTSAAIKPSTSPLTNISAPIMSSPTITMKTTLSITMTTTAPPNAQATATKVPSASSILTSTVNKLASETTETPKTVSSVSFVTTPPPAMVNPPKTTPFTLTSTSKPDLSSSLPATSFNKVPVTVSLSYPLTAKPTPPAPLISSKIPTTEVMAASKSVSTTSVTPPDQFSTADLNKTSQSFVSESSSSTATTFTKTQVSSVSVLSTVSKSQAPPTSAPPVYLNETIPTKLTATSSMSANSIPTPALAQISPMSSTSSLSVSKEGPLSISQPKISPAPSETPSFLSKMPTLTSQISASSPQIPLSTTTLSTHPALSQTSSCPISSAPLSRDGLSRKRESDPCLLDGNLTLSSKTPEPRDTLQENSHQIKEDKKKTSQGHGTGLSKIPVVGGGRVGKIPVRISHNTEEEANKDMTTSAAPEESAPHINSHDSASKDKISISEVAVVTSKQSQEESQTQSKAPTCSPRDSKIPVKHGSQIPQANRTKIPVSKVPVRRAAGAKPAAQSGTTQIRK
ncbi:mucin-2 [Periophthalmus magnuspinnatus]|uniref:mucin-2 n=1 Tax=Periophthalmus magnuspinnatus TaxID=409849 RepID=UPI0024365D00|nr:mucin-2 [Periophthalmus magnuspinnatus]